jgi:hypothetical protein
MDGWEFFGGIPTYQAMMPKVVIYMVSSSVDEKMFKKSISALSGYLVKPISKT